MLYVMIFQKFPFDGETTEDIKNKIVNSGFKIPSDRPASEDL